MTHNPTRRLPAHGALLALLALAAFLAAHARAIEIPTVPVGNAGNAADPDDGDEDVAGVQNFGSVGYEYRMGKYEVTVAQYAAFLNAVAATDTYGLYSELMTHSASNGIVRSGVSGSYSYSVVGAPNHPVNAVSWTDAARFVNWLHNGQPTGPQNAGTTEDGAYTLGGMTFSVPSSGVPRNPGALWFLPNENEWYKAAYHQPAAEGGDADDYWDFPTATNSTPYSDQPPGTGAPTPSNTANFALNDGLANDYNDGFAVTGSSAFVEGQNYLTDVGAYTGSDSYYGTYDQLGNVTEWGEHPWRQLRGGYYGTGPVGKTFLWTEFLQPQVEDWAIGFRVAAHISVPEPGSALLAALGCGVLCWWQTRRRRVI
jgi:formylglycine-generating enzyme required for sulfatase activity